jgi:pyruvate/2-oxoglutarate dehydrogenase complex dihydrolipoamide dehydrogenase (E3) component
MDFDFAVIGGGSAGYAGARTAAALGLKTIVVEGGSEVGGLCILRGCMPSKTLIESANRMMTIRNAHEFGLRADQTGFDGPAIIARKRRIIGGFADYRREQLETGKFEFVRGRAVLTDPHTVVIDNTTFTAKSILLSTGSVIASAPLPGLAEANALTSDDVLDLEDIPSSLIVLGGGPIALEMAHYFGGLGADVTVIQRSPQVLRGVDEDIARVVEGAFRERGIRVFTGTEVLGIERSASGVSVRFRHGTSEEIVVAAELLNALGRSPNTTGLGLDRAGVELDGRRIRTRATQQTSVPHIFAGGDCCGPFEVVHIAIQQGEIAARNAARLVTANEPLETIDYRLKLYAVFTEPQVAAVGLSETEAVKIGRPVRVAKYPFDDHGKSIAMGETHGFVKLLSDPATGEIVGASVVGPHASDLIHEVVVAMACRLTCAQLAAVPHYHPTLSEIWTYPAEELAASA